MQLITNELLSFLMAEFKLEWNGPHGIHHWMRVHDNGLWIASLDKEVNSKIVALFGILHDVCRVHDTGDLEHGSRASHLVDKLNGEFFVLDEEEESTLKYACLMHPYPVISFDPTVGACWDADRLELPRGGIQIDPKYLSTEVAKNYIDSLR